MTPRTTLAIGMPVRNGERFLESALTSLLTQDLDDLAVVVSDNASTDATSQIVRDLAASDRRIQYHALDVNIGANANFNRTFELAWGQLRPRYFKWAAHDDVCLPGFLSGCVAALAADAGNVLAYPRTVLVDEEGRALPGVEDPGPKGTDQDPVRRFAEILADEFGVFYIFGVIRAEALASTQLFGPHWPPDKALASWLSLLGRFVQLPEPLFLRRTHGEQSSALPLRQQARWSHPGFGRYVPTPVWATMAYARGIASAPLSAAQRRAAYAVLARKYLDGDKWRRVFVPGRDNYLGLHGRRAHAQPVLPPGNSG